jgi:hypothetical protein
LPRRVSLLTKNRHGWPSASSWAVAAAFRPDMQHSVRYGQLDILLRVNAGKIGPYDQRPIVAKFLDTDQIVGFPPMRERHRPERHHPRPLIEHPVEVAEDIARRPAQFTPGYTWRNAHLTRRS